MVEISWGYLPSYVTVHPIDNKGQHHNKYKHKSKSKIERKRTQVKWSQSHKDSDTKRSNIIP